MPVITNAPDKGTALLENSPQPRSPLLENGTLPRVDSSNLFPHADTQRTLANTALGKLSNLENYGKNFSEGIKKFIRINFDARDQGRPLTKEEKYELKQIASLFKHEMAASTLQIITGHIARLNKCDHKIALGMPEAIVKFESDKILNDIDKRLGLLSTWYMQAKESISMPKVALAAFNDTKEDFGRARYTQAYHNSKGIDCSGLVGEYLTRLLARFGIKENLSGITTDHLFNMNSAKTSKDPLVIKLRKYFNIALLKDTGIENLEAGDCIVRRVGGKGHTGTYIGDGKVMHSTTDRDQNGFGVDTLHEFLRKNRVHKVLRLKDEFTRPKGMLA